MTSSISPPPTPTKASTTLDIVDVTVDEPDVGSPIAVETFTASRTTRSKRASEGTRPLPGLPAEQPKTKSKVSGKKTKSPKKTKRAEIEAELQRRDFFRRIGSTFAVHKLLALHDADVHNVIESTPELSGVYQSRLAFLIEQESSSSSSSNSSSSSSSISSDSSSSCSNSSSSCSNSSSSSSNSSSSSDDIDQGCGQLDHDGPSDVEQAVDQECGQVSIGPAFVQPYVEVGLAVNPELQRRIDNVFAAAINSMADQIVDQVQESVVDSAVGQLLVEQVDQYIGHKRVQWEMEAASALLEAARLAQEREEADRLRLAQEQEEKARTEREQQEAKLMEAQISELSSAILNQGVVQVEQVGVQVEPTVVQVEPTVVQVEPSVVQVEPVVVQVEQVSVQVEPASVQVETEEDRFRKAKTVFPNMTIEQYRLMLSMGMGQL